MSDPAGEISAVAALALGVIERAAVTPAYGRLLRAIAESHIATTAARPERRGFGIELPLLAARAVGGAEDRAFMLAAAILLLEAGIFALDHLMDDELDGPLAELPRAAVLTGAVSFISFLPHLAIGDLPAPPALRAYLAKTLAEGMAAIAAGQAGEAGTSLDSPPSPSEVERSIAGKTGARRALYARLGAAGAGAAPAAIDALAAYGHALGMARQIGSDIDDLFGGDDSRDIAAGACTLPLACFFATASSDEAEALRADVAAARRGEPTLAAVRRRLRDGGALRAALQRQEAFCALARRHLRDIDAPVAITRRLEAHVAQISLGGASHG